MFCPQCGTRIQDGASFCPGCGKPVAEMPRAQMINPGEAEGQPGNINPGTVLAESVKYSAKLFFLCIAAALIICAVIGVIVWFVEYRDKPKVYNGAKEKSQTVWEEEGLSIKATGLSHERVIMDALILKVKNKTGHDLTIKAVSGAVNGACVPVSLEETVAQGQTQDMRLEIDLASCYTSDLNVSTPGIFTLELLALDAASGEELYRSGLVTVRTTKAEEEQNASFSPYFEERTELFDKSGIRVETFGYLLDPIGPGFGIENNSDNTVKVTIRIQKISGVEMRTDEHYYIKSAVIQPGTIGACYTPAYFAELQQIDEETPIFPVTDYSGTVTVSDAYDGTVIWEEPFDYAKAE